MLNLFNLPLTKTSGHVIMTAFFYNPNLDDVMVLTFYKQDYLCEFESIDSLKQDLRSFISNARNNEKRGYKFIGWV